MSQLKKAAVILGGGRGTRLREIAAPFTKTILPVAGLPIIGYAAQLTAPFVEKIIVVGHPSTGSDVVEAVSSSVQNGHLSVQLALQTRPLGMADAIRVGFAALKGDWAAVVVAGDNIILDRQNMANTLLNLTTTNPLEKKIRLTWTYKDFPAAEARRFSVYRPLTGSRGELIEKPAVPPTTMCWCGPVAFASTQEALRRLGRLIPSARGELEASDLINSYLREGTGRHFKIVGEFFDVGTPAALAEAEAVISQVVHR